MDDVNPCELWTAVQLRSFRVDEEPSSSSPSPNGFGGMGCRYFGLPGDDLQLLYAVYTYPRSGLDQAMRERSPGTAAVAVEVAGFPAFQQQRSLGDSACDVIIGPASGQHLTVSVTVTPNELSMDEFCTLSMTAATAAMENLQAQR